MHSWCLALKEQKRKKTQTLPTKKNFKLFFNKKNFIQNLIEKRSKVDLISINQKTIRLYLHK